MPALAPKVDDVYTYWTEKPPYPSERCKHWIARIRDGWKPNRRIRQMGYSEAAQWYGVYVWEFINVIRPLVDCVQVLEE